MNAKSLALPVPKTAVERPIAALFVSGRSIYKHLPGVTAFDAKRDAKTFDASTPAVAHPPCRCWSKYLSHQAKPLDRKAEMDLGRWAVRAIQRAGGVLEQPHGSALFAEMGLPMPLRSPDGHGGFTIYVEQAWFGYASKKATWLYIVGVSRDALPPVPFRLEEGRAKASGLSQAARSRTMPAFARWLCQVARAVPPGRTAGLEKPSQSIP